jgi:hypothetical protein
VHIGRAYLFVRCSGFLEQSQLFCMDEAGVDAGSEAVRAAVLEMEKGPGAVAPGFFADIVSRRGRPAGQRYRHLETRECPLGNEGRPDGCRQNEALRKVARQREVRRAADIGESRRDDLPIRLDADAVSGVEPPDIGHDLARGIECAIQRPVGVISGEREV